MKNRKLNKKGMTLIEVLVAALILTIVVIAASQMYVTASSAQRRAYGKQNALDSSRYALEYMARAIRQSEIPPGAFTTNRLHIHHPDPKKCGSFYTQDEGCSVYYQLDSGRLRESIVLIDAAPASYQPITELSNVFIESLRFTGYSQDTQVNGQYVHPRVTITMTVRSELNKPSEESRVRIQTTISSRDPRWLSTQ